MTPAETPTSSVVSFRKLWPGDVPFLFDSWLKSFRKAREVAEVPGHIYRDGQHALAARLLERCGALVAFNPRIPEQIIGWAVSERVETTFLVHYVYVKHPFRRFGIGRALLLEAGPGCSRTQHTHRTELGEHLVRRCASSFNPYAR